MYLTFSYKCNKSEASISLSKENLYEKKKQRKIEMKKYLKKSKTIYKNSYIFSYDSYMFHITL